MKRASYRHAVKWIAENDEAGSEDARDPQIVGEYISTLLVADIFGVESERVATDVVAHRVRIDSTQGAIIVSTK